MTSVVIKVIHVTWRTFDIMRTKITKDFQLMWLEKLEV